MDNHKIIKKISNLYELLLAVNYSNNLKNNCQSFLEKLKDLKDINFCSICIKNDLLISEKDEGMFCLYSKPIELNNDKIKVKSLFKLVKNADYKIITAEQDEFNKVNILNKTKGKYILFPLSSLGILRIYIDKADKNIFSEYELKELTKIIAKLSTLISSSLKHINLKVEVKKTMRYKDYYHNLTNLPNRLLFDDRLTVEINKSQQGTIQTKIAVLVIHIDKLSLVNNAFGYEKGDEILKKIAERLLSFTDNNNQGTASHLGGNDFALFINIRRQKKLVEFIKVIINKINNPFIIKNQEIIINCNIGVAIYPDDSKKAKELLKKSEIAMQKTKDKYNNTFNFYNIEMEDKSVQKISLENNLKKALERKEFIIYYQPQINVKNGKILGLEALLRWQKPSGEIISPGKFIPYAEKSGLIIPIGNWVLKKACKHVKNWHNKGFNNLELSINISAIQFQQNNFYEKIKTILEEVDFPPNCLKLEITENLLMQDLANINPVLNNLKSLGVRISIDDFGTGFSSLSYLTNLPICELKIDKSFIFGLEENDDNKIIAETIISLGNNLKTNIIAEGVEKIEHLQFLKEKNCNEAQGYLISHPLPREKVEKLLYSKDKFKDLNSFYND